MKYIKNGPFITCEGGSFGIETDGKIEKATNGRLISWLLSSYRHAPEKGLNLSVGELRSLNRTIDILGSTADVDGYRLEEVDFQIAKHVAVTMATILTPRNSPLVEDLFEEAVFSRPMNEEKVREG